MKIYTKTGDAGETGLFGAKRVRKDDVRIEAYGTVDELNAALGLVRAETLPEPLGHTLQRVQSELFSVGAELATPDPFKHGTALVGEPHVVQLEHEIDHLEAGLAPLKRFILPAGCRAAALLHVARGVCRRAERRVVTLAAAEPNLQDGRVVRYLNRLGDYLFVAARYANAEARCGETEWIKPKPEK
ncbi:MAG TPA: cob(I)yrinic acid a,c-diamide adenosyltransferase [Pirellulaceae bacterium]|nr:cob(I)yrinic acid a,c-diamide adenosyltransferase [Pirellulaceae bacterium]